ncbi:DASH family cryptochrome [Agarivorans sp. Alg241-V36]|uniref:DASH family cryptochrome n=1 Tax=Agarivorans sp. Alg241-V36 TaxID=2305992 RepID=UPI0013D757AA|nr:DASH family cryptochrome [Agarivorans sp. Alg241-V36]
MRLGLFIFDNDCRVQDNPALEQLAQQVDQLICVYINQPTSPFVQHFSQTSVSSAKQAYLNQTLSELNLSLKQLGQQLFIEDGSFEQQVACYIQHYRITDMGRSVHPGSDEAQQWLALQQAYPLIRFHAANSSCLFEQQQLPFGLTKLPASFTPFRKLVEALEIPKTLPLLKQLPKAPNLLAHAPTAMPPAEGNRYYRGGEQAAQDHLTGYFSSQAASSYKQTRNALSGEDFSTGLSPFLAHGALSPRQAMQALKAYEAEHGANESSYWIYFELLWREYFYWYARAHGDKLFVFSGTTGKTPHCSFYPQRFKQWCSGTTPYPLVNALMHQLNASGWMSNRGRQIVASCLVNELQVDWRYGAAYFEQCLIDYDVASNWGNWQYIAGVGADPRGGRHFDIDKQTAMFDPEQKFIKHWKGQQSVSPLQTSSMVDWPS